MENISKCSILSREASTILQSVKSIDFLKHSEALEIVLIEFLAEPSDSFLIYESLNRGACLNH